MGATCLIVRWVTDTSTSTDLCGISGHWSFEGLLPSKLSTFPIHKLVMGTEAIDESRLAGAFLSVFQLFLRAMCLALLHPPQSLSPTSIYKQGRGFRTALHS